MEALRKKWNSRRGASILLAMLFLLVCIMVGSSVVMAASSNAGKTRSNKEEEQKNLTVSSALTLVVDELEHTEYVGVYEYEKEECEHKVEVFAGYDENGGAKYTTVPMHDYDHHYTLKDGDLRYYEPKQDGTKENSKLKDQEVLPLHNYLDVVFFENIEDFIEKQNKQSNSEEGNQYEYTDGRTGENKKNDKTNIFKKLELTVTSNPDYEEIFTTVKIEAELKEDGSIELKAYLEGEPKYRMLAVLRPDPDITPENRLVPAGDPEEDKDNETRYIRWKLDSIVKRDENEETEP